MLAQSVGAVLVATWAHDYAPQIRCLVLASPAFKVKLNEWIKGTRFRGQRAFGLHNGMVLDPTRTRDFMTYKLARTVGLMAPRVGWAEVWANQDYLGLYMIIERFEEEFIEYRRPGHGELGFVFEGNTVMTDEELIAAMKLEVGDTFTSAVANEDFGRIVRAYQDKGYRVLTQPDFSFDDGTYIQRVTELRIGEFQVVYDGEQGATKDFVVTRYLPAIGTVVNDDAIVDGLLDVARLGVLDVVNYGLEPLGAAGEVRVVVTVRKRMTGELRPAAQFATDSGFSASLGYNERNFLGRAHTVGAELNVLSTDVGVMLGGRIGYEIPWLYVDALDFREVPTSFSVSLFSVVSNNQPLSANGQTTMTYPGLAPTEENRVRVGEYTTRSTGAGFTVGRPIAPFTSLVVAANGAFNEHKFEPTKVDCIIENGEVTNASACYIPSELAVTFLPTGGLSAFASTRVTYDDRDSSDFPTRGVVGYGGLGVGFGNDFLDPVTSDRTTYVYEQVIAGARTYLRMSEVMPGEITDENHVFAVRLDVGHQFGGSYPESKRFFVGRSNDVATQIRGYTREDFNLSKSYVTSSFEYRYDFQLSTFATQTVIGIVFVDLGWASNVPGFPQYETPLFAGTGVGVQLNLGFGGVVLPAVRLDYAFSERHPAGVFSAMIIKRITITIVKPTPRPAWYQEGIARERVCLKLSTSRSISVVEAATHSSWPWSLGLLVQMRVARGMIPARATRIRPSTRRGGTKN